MGVYAFLLLSLALASQFMLALANNDTVCTYEGQRFKLDRSGQLPLETHYNCDTEIECKEKCDAKSTCIIWQWQPTRRICWIMDVVPYPDRNSDFGINNCDNGKPTENAQLCEVTKGDRNNVWQDYRGMTKDDCELECILDSDCLIWQHIRSKKLCRIHKLEIDLSKQSQVGIHYCSSSKPTTTTTTTTTIANVNSCSLNRNGVRCAPDCGVGARTFSMNHLCSHCHTEQAALAFSNQQRGRVDKYHNHVYVNVERLPLTWKAILNQNYWECGEDIFVSKVWICHRLQTNIPFQWCNLDKIYQMCSLRISPAISGHRLRDECNLVVPELFLEVFGNQRK